MFLYQKIQSLRQGRGWSRRELARNCNSSGTHIRLLEQGKRRDPRLSTIIMLAKVFDLTVDELLDGTEFDLKNGTSLGR